MGVSVCVEDVCLLFLASRLIANVTQFNRIFSEKNWVMNARKEFPFYWGFRRTHFSYFNLNSVHLYIHNKTTDSIDKSREFQVATKQ